MSSEKGKTTEEQLEERIGQLQARLQMLRARRQEQHRKEDTRRKILIGSMILAKIASGEMKWEEAEKLRKQLDEYLVRPNDRALFALDGDGAGTARTGKK